MCAPVAQSALSHIINGIEISKPRVNGVMKILATRTNNVTTMVVMALKRAHAHTCLLIYAYEHKFFMTAHIYNRRCTHSCSALLFIDTHMHKYIRTYLRTYV